MARRRRTYKDLSPRQRRKFLRVLREFAEGRLRSSSGEKVTSREQALAIAFSEADRVGK